MVLPLELPAELAEVLGLPLLPGAGEARGRGAGAASPSSGGRGRGTDTGTSSSSGTAQRCPTEPGAAQPGPAHGRLRQGAVAAAVTRPRGGVGLGPPPRRGEAEWPGSGTSCAGRAV